MFVVRRPFKSNGQVYEIGSIINDPTSIRLFKSRLQERIIVEVNEDNKVQLINYFKEKIGKDLTTDFEAKVIEEPSSEEPVNENAEQPVNENSEQKVEQDKPKAEQPAVKPVAKVVIK